MRELILASASPRRRELLPLLGIPFEVAPADVAELTEGDPAELVVANALLKARAIDAGRSDRRGEPPIVLGCDTDVVIDGRVLGKPADRAAARERLELLSGRAHEVLSGVAVLAEGREETGLERTVVGFRELDERLISAYLDSGEWEGRAGGYAVQGLGSALIASVEGDLSSVIGLPLSMTRELIDRVQND